MPYYPRKNKSPVKVTASPFPTFQRGDKVEYIGANKEMAWQFYVPGKTVSPVELLSEGMPAWWPTIWIWGLTDRKRYRVSRKSVRTIDARRVESLRLEGNTLPKCVTPGR